MCGDRSSKGVQAHNAAVHPRAEAGTGGCGHSTLTLEQVARHLQKGRSGGSVSGGEQAKKFAVSATDKCTSSATNLVLAGAEL